MARCRRRRAACSRPPPFTDAVEKVGDRSIRTCCGTAATAHWGMPAMIRERCKPGSLSARARSTKLFCYCRMALRGLRMPKAPTCPPSQPLGLSPGPCRHLLPPFSGPFRLTLATAVKMSRIIKVEAGDVEQIHRSGELIEHMLYTGQIVAGYDSSQEGIR
jgi:hypothetical protein